MSDLFELKRSINAAVHSQSDERFHCLTLCSDDVIHELFLKSVWHQWTQNDLCVSCCSVNVFKTLHSSMSFRYCWWRNMMQQRILTRTHTHAHVKKSCIHSVIYFIGPAVMILPIRIKLKKLEETVNMSYFHYAEKNSQQKSETYIFLKMEKCQTILW